jgi:hypothetical protein
MVAMKASSRLRSALASSGLAVTVFNSFHAGCTDSSLHVLPLPRNNRRRPTVSAGLRPLPPVSDSRRVLAQLFRSGNLVVSSRRCFG